MSSLVSIITPCYNSSKFIKDCIESVLSQTYDNWELIIVDDASRDKTPNIIQKFVNKDERIKAIFLDKNIGAAEARNLALRKAIGKYIAFLDSDDLWLPNKLYDQLNFMKIHDIAFCFTAYHHISEDGEQILKKIEVPKEISYNKYLRNTIIGCLTVMIDKEKVGDLYMPNIRSSHDMALWLSIMKKGFKAYGLNESLAKYRLVSTSNTSNIFKAAYDVWKVYRNIEGLNWVFSCYNFINYCFQALRKRI